MLFRQNEQNWKKNQQNYSFRILFILTLILFILSKRFHA